MAIDASMSVRSLQHRIRGVSDGIESEASALTSLDRNTLLGEVSIIPTNSNSKHEIQF